jgi:hypothetical protein
MDKLTMNYHLKLQEMCDCYMETEFSKELEHMARQPIADPEEEAIKYLALAVMYAITEQAGSLSLKQKGKSVRAMIKTTDTIELPPPPNALFDKIDEIVRAILHLEEDKGKMELSLGLRNGEVNVEVKVKREGDKKSIKIKFPS